MKSICMLPAVALGILVFSVPVPAAGKGNPEQGRALYVEYCLQCHGGQGRGWGWSKKVPPPPIPIPDLSNTQLMNQLSDQYLFDIIKGGGEAVGKTRLMPPAGRVMNDEAIWDVITYLRFLTQEAQGSSKKER
ncbi:MAG: c-type cytochrome [Candidatus Methylomirabilales bacterium]